MPSVGINSFGETLGEERSRRLIMAATLADRYPDNGFNTLVRGRDLESGLRRAIQLEEIYDAKIKEIINDTEEQKSDSI